MKTIPTACLSLLLLTQLAGCPLVQEVTIPGARVSTTQGEFVVELNEADAPVTVANFLQYVDDGFYDGTVFHLVYSGIAIQGGGYDPNLAELPTREPIVNESANGLSNVRGTIAMARTDAPNSAAAQFFINLADNTDLDATADTPGYTVFGRVVEGLDVADRIAAVPTSTDPGFEGVPVDPVIIQSITRVEFPTGVLGLSPYGELYAQNVQYQAAYTVRNVAAALFGYVLFPY